LKLGGSEIRTGNRIFSLTLSRRPDLGRWAFRLAHAMKILRGLIAARQTIETTSNIFAKETVPK